jgi:hypothetical protein
MLLMFLQGATIDQNVVYVDDNKVIKPFPENVIHESAKCGGCIGEPKRCHNPTLAKCEDEIHTPKVGDLEPSGTPKFLEFNSKGQKTLPWGVLSVIGRVLKCRCPK